MAEHAVAELRAHPGDAVYAQNAAGKAWTAARMAAQAVVFCTTKGMPKGTDALRDALADVARERDSKRLSDFRADVADAYGDLHLRCSSDGDCSTRSLRRIQSVKDSLIPAAQVICKSPPPAPRGLRGK